MISFLSKLSPKQKAMIFTSVILAFLAVWIPSRFRTVDVKYNGTTTTLHTASLSLDEILDEAGIELSPDDRVVCSGFDTYGFFGDFGQNICVIDIRTAIGADVLADGLKYHVDAMTGDTAEQILELAGLTVRPDDLLSVDRDSIVSDGDTLKLTRVDYVQTTEEETIERGETHRGTSLFRSGKSVIISYGKNGVMQKTYTQKLVDGEVTETVLTDETVIKAATDDIYLTGDGSPCSPLDYGYEIINNVPTSYKAVYSNKRATGYFARAGSGTASGRRAQMGYVAVDPKIIPYGTKLWIVASDGGRFVYGYALAADTGGAMKSGKNFVDLYYDTYYECVLNGVKYVDVYVLE